MVATTPGPAQSHCLPPAVPSQPWEPPWLQLLLCWVFSGGWLSLRCCGPRAPASCVVLSGSGRVSPADAWVPHVTALGVKRGAGLLLEVSVDHRLHLRVEWGEGAGRISLLNGVLFP